MGQGQIMLWKICLFLSIFSFLIILIVGIIWRRRRKARNLNSLITVLIVAIYVSLVFLFYPVCQGSIVEGASVIESLALAIIKPLQVFVLNEDYNAVFAAVTALTLGSSFEWLIYLYQIWGTIMHFFAPILLAGFIVTLFQQVIDRFKLFTSGSRNIYVFSELNTKALILAGSCVDQDRSEGRKKPRIVFANVREQSEDESAELTGQARRIGALCMKDGILNLHARFEKKHGDVWFFILGADETKNTHYALSLIDRYKNAQNISLYVLSDSVETELMLESAMGTDTKMTIRRINSEQALVYSYLYDTEKNCLFKYTCESQDGEKVLSVILAGLGKLGTEFLRALVWYGQMPQIRLQIHVFEKDPLAEEKFTSLCPELMEMNHNHIEGDSQYDIWFHHSKDGGGIDVETEDFDQEILGLPAASVAFVVLGDDAKNIRIAVKMRRLFTQEGIHPAIQAVVHDPERNEQKKRHDFEDFKGNKYDIDFIGDAQTAWSYENIVMPGLEEMAEACNLHYAQIAKDDEKMRAYTTRQFYQFEYNRKSSMSSAIRAKVRYQMADLIPGADLPGNELTEDERLTIERWEHIGWNAYMRSEGYRWAQERNDMAKCHNLLVPFDELDEEQKPKDSMNWLDMENLLSEEKTG